MKVLVERPTKTYDVVVLRKHWYSLPSEYAGRCNFGNVVLKSDEPMWLGEKVHSITIDDITMYGILPLVQHGDMYKCSIDYFEMDK